MEILDNLPVEISVEDVLKVVRLSRRNISMEKLIRNLTEKVRPVARPKVLYKVSYIEKRDENSVNIDGKEFDSRILKMNLENAERVFPYIITAGRELESVEIPKSDFMKIFCLDAIKELFLESAMRYFDAYLTKKYALGTMSHMNPGSLRDWPVTQQTVLFSIFGDVDALIGVKLTSSFLMDPIKSVSGIYFPTEVDFKSCMLCSMQRCSKRRAAYNPDMVEKYGEGVR